MPSRPLRRLLSGGQTGVDRGALRAARDAGLEIVGWCPPGRACADGTISDAWPLVETPRDRSERAPDVPRSQRTEWNVRDADAVLILRPASPSPDDPGTAFTARCAEHYGRPLIEADPDDPEAATTLGRWLDRHAVTGLDVAGPSEEVAPGIEAAAYRLLLALFSR